MILPHQELTLNTQPQWKVQKLMYMNSLNINALIKLTNDPILHNPTWLPMPTKIPLDISNFEGKPSEYLANHVMISHI
jgi:hypothetical protein